MSVKIKITVIVSTLVVACFALYLCFGFLPRPAQGMEKETDLALFSLLMSKADVGLESCWLGSQGAELPKRVFAASESVFDYFKLRSKVRVIDQHSKVKDVESCLSDSGTLLVEFPQPKLEEFPSDLRAMIGTKSNQLVLGTPEERMGYVKTSIMFKYPDGKFFFLFERR